MVEIVQKFLHVLNLENIVIKWLHYYIDDKKDIIDNMSLLFDCILHRPFNLLLMPNTISLFGHFPVLYINTKTIPECITVIRYMKHRHVDFFRKKIHITNSIGSHIDYESKYEHFKFNDVLEKELDRHRIIKLAIVRLYKEALENNKKEYIYEICSIVCGSLNNIIYGPRQTQNVAKLQNFAHKEAARAKT